MHGQSLDFLNLLFLPLMALTFLELAKNWRSVTDDNLTLADRILLQRTVLFLLMPVVVFCHELGHVLAIKTFGGTIKEFHYAFLWGYVVPEGNFSQTEIVWTYFSGNLVQILIGLAAGFLALFATAPALVALLIYLFLWAVGGTAIIYALLSFTGFYGDWIAIYSQGVPVLAGGILLFQIFCAGLVLWALYSRRSRLWFAGKTDPNFALAYRSFSDKASSNSSPTHLLIKAALFWQAGLPVEKYLYPVLFGPGANQRKPFLSVAQGPRGSALDFLDAVLSTNWPLRIKAEAYMAKGLLFQLQRKYDLAKLMFSQASLANAKSADAHYYKACLLEAEGLKDEAGYELGECAGLEFEDSELYQAYRLKHDG